MVKDHKELVRVCGELNLNTLKDKIEVEYQKYLSGLQKIKNVRDTIIVLINWVSYHCMNSVGRSSMGKRNPRAARENADWQEDWTPASKDSDS